MRKNRLCVISACAVCAQPEVFFFSPVFRISIMRSVLSDLVCESCRSEMCPYEAFVIDVSEAD